MADERSVHSVIAGLLPNRYIPRYEQDLARALDSIHLAGEAEPRSLESFYIPMQLHRQGLTAEETGRRSDIWDVLFRSPRMALVGEAGAGKTATLKYVAIQLARHRMPESYIRRLSFLHQGQAFDHLLPIYADVGQLDTSARDLADPLAGILDDHGFPNASRFLGQRLKEGACLLLLDNVDSLAAAEQCSHLNELLAAYPRVQVVVGARTPPHALAQFACFEPVPFAAPDIQAFIQRRLGEGSAPANGLLQALERDAGIFSLASNPLLLSVLACTSATATALPLPLCDLYASCLRAFIGDVETTAMASSRVAPSTSAESVLAEVAHSFHERHMEQFTAQELQGTVQQIAASSGRAEAAIDTLNLAMSGGLLRQVDDGRYAFLRPALQEYMTAQAIVAKGSLDQMLAECADDPWWHNVIVLAVSMARSATGLFPATLVRSNRPEALDLTARCMAEFPTVSNDAKSDVSARLFDVLEGDATERWHAAAVRIAALQGQRIQDYFPEMLRQGTGRERQRAALVMGRVGTPDWALVPLLGALERSRPPDVRRQAAWALGRLKDKRAIRALMDTLKGDEEQVASEAASALALIGQPAVPWLVSALNEEQAGMRQMAVMALGRMGALAMEPLIGLVRDEKRPDDTVCGAAEALGLLGDAGAIPHLIHLLRTREGRLAECAGRALAAMGDAAVQPLVASLPTRSAELQVRKAIVNALVTIGQPAIQTLIQCLDHSSAAVRGAAEEALARIGPAATEGLVSALRTEDWDLRRRIAQILSQIGDEELTEPLLPLLADEDPGVRARAAEILGRLGQDVAVEPLIRVLQTDSDDFVRRAAIMALAELHSETAVAPLIAILSDPQLRDIAAMALDETAEAAVEPLVQAISQQSDLSFRDACVKALRAIGARGRLEESTMLTASRVYSELYTAQPTLDEIISLLEHVSWWQPGREWLSTFSTVRILAQAQTLDDVARCSEELMWAHGWQDPFRPPIKSILRALDSVSQNVRLYLDASRREGQRDAMLSAIDSITDIQTTMETQLLPFEQKPIADLVASWRVLTEDAIKTLRGRAQLEIVPLRADLPIDSTTSAAMIVFRLTNVGDSAARNLNATLRPGAEDGFEVVGTQIQQLDPLGTGMQRDVEFWIKPHTASEATYAFEVSYDDDERSGNFHPTSGRIRFFVVAEEYRPIPSSPYVMGPPVKTEQMFYGRQDVFDWIEDNVCGAYQQNILVLHGERRMGKTSVLYQLLNRPPSPKHICVFFSLEVSTTSSLGDILYDLARAIGDQTADHGLELPHVRMADFRRDPQRSFHRFLDSTESALGERRLLLMIDEIDILIAKVEQHVVSEDVFHYLRGLWQHCEKIAFIVTGAYKVRQMLRDNESILFQVAKPYAISYLDRTEAEALIVEPVAEYLTYDNMVVDKIIRVTACHPYFVQYICDSLVKLARRMRKNWVYLPEIEVVLQEVIQDDAGVLQNAIYAPLSNPEQKALASLANVTDDRRIFVPAEAVEHMLDRHGVGISRRELLDALRALCERDLVSEKRLGQSLQYGFKMDLIRMWLRQNEVLLRLSQEARI